MALLGLGQEKDVQKAIEYFEVAAETDPHAQNALGVIYYGAPDHFEQDLQRLLEFGPVKRDIKRSKKYLEKAANAGNLNARYNMGVLWMDPIDNDHFSYSKAYEQFKFAASQGHTMSSYNLGVMNFIGLGTYKSCKLSLTFLKHVVSVGEQSQ